LGGKWEERLWGTEGTLKIKVDENDLEEGSTRWAFTYLVVSE